ncbi:MAG TPA: hypothetical protein DHV38_03550 [Corynebacterium casei]|nr:hypothetical protein [Corynebacterium casei]
MQYARVLMRFTSVGGSEKGYFDVFTRVAVSFRGVGFHTPRRVILPVLGIITAFFYWNNDFSAAIILSFVLFVIGAFNIAVDADNQR